MVNEAKAAARRAEAEAKAAQATVAQLAEVMEQVTCCGRAPAEREASSTQEAAARSRRRGPRPAGFEADVQRVVAGAASTVTHMEDSARSLGSLAGAADRASLSVSLGAASA